MANSSVRSQSNYSFAFDFERNCDSEWKQKWMERNWYLSIYISIAYVLIIHMGEKFMRSRPAFQLQTPLFIWNLGNLIFTVFGTYRIFPGMFFLLTNYGFKHSVCDDSFYTKDVVNCWIWFIVASKVTDLGDTVFIVLKKRPLLALHWVHHSTALIMTWIGYAFRCPTGHWATTVNFPVHAVLYFYFTMKAIKISLPRWYVWLIIYLEILQLFLLLIVCIRSVMAWMLDEPCSTTIAVILVHISLLSVNLIVVMKYLLSIAKGKTDKQKKL